MQSAMAPRPKKGRRVWPYVLLLFVFLAAAVAGAFFASTSLVDKPPTSTQAHEEGLIAARDKATIMIMGVDEREDDVGRSDTLMIATIDPETNQAALLSIPRDTRVKIKGHGYDKINAAYAYGGHNLTQATVENFLGVRMDHYIIINPHAFQRIIDAIGGIDIDVEKRMYYKDPWDDDGGLVIDLYPGMQHMDGKTAESYVRYRDEEGDIGRIGRQQKFMRAIMDKLTSPAILPRLPAIIHEVLSSVRTDLSFRQILEFAGALKNAQKNGLKTDMVPGRPLYIDGISYWIPNILQLRRTLAETLDVNVSPSMRNAMERASVEYESSIPSSATEVPASDNSIGRARRSSDSSSSNSSRSRSSSTYGSSGGSNHSSSGSANSSRDTSPSNDRSVDHTTADSSAGETTTSDSSRSRQSSPTSNSNVAGPSSSSADSGFSTPTENSTPPAPGSETVPSRSR